MTANELREKFLNFFHSEGHAVLKSASLVPENDPTVLFTTAGMHPLVPYLLGESHPAGNRLVNIQKCIRTGDIDEVGDNRHLTFFEMLGNWSLGYQESQARFSPQEINAPYWKKEAIEYSFEFLTSPRWLGLHPKRIYISVFRGDKDAPRDKESIKYWQERFQKSGISAREDTREHPNIKNGGRIFMYGKSENWWGPAGKTGPCGPDTEIFYDSEKKHDTKYGAKCHPNCDCGRFFEIWNNVFMEYNKTEQGVYEPLKQKNIDTGMGLERTVAMLQGRDSVYETELFMPIIRKLEELSGRHYKEGENKKSMHIIADHLRAATFILGDEKTVTPSNLDRGYVLRRLIRRAIRFAKLLNIENVFCFKIAEIVVKDYKHIYPELKKNKNFIIEQLVREEEKFAKTIEKGLRMFRKMTKDKAISGREAFALFSTYGFPYEMTKELAKEENLLIDEETFWAEFHKHQERSRRGAQIMFRGGLADHSREVTKLHTATHLLHAALRQVLGEHVEQRGSNITAERLRFDFSHSEKMTLKQINQTENLVNQKIKADLPVTMEEMSEDEARHRGALGLFAARYGERVKVYTIGQPGEIFSKEICAGPHVMRLGKLGRFKIVKEEASSAGIRRIKAELKY